MEKGEVPLTEESVCLKYALKAKDEYLTNVSHELRSPLNSIIGFSEILSSEAYGALNDKQKSYVEHILNGGKRLLSLINNVVDLAKMEAMKTELAITEFSINSLLQDVLALIKEPAFKKDVAISLKISEGIDKIDADQPKLKHVIYNFLSNAVRFTPKGGRVEILVRRAASGIEVEVSDTGIGIAAEDLEKVFEAFKQIETPGSGQPCGSGLSMAISKKVIEMHGGKIWVESKGPMCGASFKFTLPIKNN